MMRRMWSKSKSFDDENEKNVASAAKASRHDGAPLTPRNHAVTTKPPSPVKAALLPKKDGDDDASHFTGCSNASSSLLSSASTFESEADEEMIAIADAKSVERMAEQDMEYSSKEEQAPPMNVQAQQQQQDRRSNDPVLEARCDSADDSCYTHRSSTGGTSVVATPFTDSDDSSSCIELSPIVQVAVPSLSTEPPVVSWKIKAQSIFRAAAGSYSDASSSDGSISTSSPLASPVSLHGDASVGGADTERLVALDSPTISKEDPQPMEQELESKGGSVHAPLSLPTVVPSPTDFTSEPSEGTQEKPVSPAAASIESARESLGELHEAAKELLLQDSNSCHEEEEQGGHDEKETMQADTASPVDEAETATHVRDVESKGSDGNDPAKEVPSVTVSKVTFPKVAELAEEEKDTAPKADTVSPVDEDASTPKVACPQATELAEQEGSALPVVRMHDFEWAYEVWRRHGLLVDKKPSSKVEKSVNKTLVKSSFKASTGRGRSPTGFDDAVDKKLMQQKVRKSTVSRHSVCPKASSGSSGSGFSRSAKSRQSLPAIAVSASSSSSKGEEKNFASVLQKWKKVSANKPSSHFLSPEQTVPAEKDAVDIRKQRSMSKSPIRGIIDGRSSVSPIRPSMARRLSVSPVRPEATAAKLTCAPSSPKNTCTDDNQDLSEPLVLPSLASDTERKSTESRTGSHSSSSPEASNKVANSSDGSQKSHMKEPLVLPQVANECGKTNGSRVSSCASNSTNVAKLAAGFNKPKESFANISKKAEPFKKNPAASTPVPEVYLDQPLSPVRRAPKSQAWKLKMDRQKKDASRKTRSSMPAMRQFKSPGRSRGDYKVAVQELLRGVDEQAEKDRAASVPRPLRQESSEKSGAKAQKETSFATVKAKDTQASSAGKYKRAQSTPRPHRPTPPAYHGRPASRPHSRQHVTPQAFDERLLQRAIDATGFPVSSAKKERSTGKSAGKLEAEAKAIRAKARDGCDIPREVNVSIKKKKGKKGRTEKKKEELDCLSPYGQRVMRNLEKIYDGTEEVRALDEHGLSDRPWRRDRLIGSVDTVTFADTDASTTVCRCSCSDSVFSGNDEMVEFFLPLMGTACTCGKRQPQTLKSGNATSLVNILRPWQVAFLGAFGIYRGEELVKANHRSGAALAASLRQYRKRMGMTPFRTKSCGMALQIWAKTSKAFVRSIRKQLKESDNKSSKTNLRPMSAPSLRLPNALYIVSSFLDRVPTDCISPGLDAVSGNATSSMSESHSSIGIALTPITSASEIDSTTSEAEI